MIKNTWPLAVLLVLIFSLTASAQRRKKDKVKEETQVEVTTKPKLVVGIIVDQMRYDYITRFWNHYGENGFKKLVTQGANCKNNHFNYAPTSTGPGHTSVYTGTYPAVHGVIGNNWYDKESDNTVYCASDDNYESVGTTGYKGKMSPHRMLTTTITDQMRLHTQMRGKTIAVSIKDRGAVLPGGHTANAAYWYEGGETGNFITSTYYMQTLPKWVQDFNASDAVEAYKKPWETLKPIASYKESVADANNYEGGFNGKATATFPYDLPVLWDNNGKYTLLAETPYGNSLTTDFALAALKNESLGKDNDTDFLAISYSSTDKVGHNFGVDSKEVQDTYLRLDLELEKLLTELDKEVGAGNYTLFLTADHAAIPVPTYLKDVKVAAGYLNMKQFDEQLEEYLKYRFGTTDVVKNISNNQIFLDHKVVSNLDMELAAVQEEIAMEVLSYEGMDKVYTGTQMWSGDYTRGLPYILQNGWHQKRSGDVLFVPKPAHISYNPTGSTHGSPFIYDTHTPLLFYGNGIKPGAVTARTEITDIAPTLAVLLGIAFPNGATGTPISTVLK